MTKLATALALAERGFLVFPLKAGAKHPPHIKRWQEHATANAAEISSWWTKWPDANIAIHCAGFVVLDVDVRSGGDETLTKIEMIDGLPPTLTTRTPTGGRHLFYRLPEGHPGVPNGANKLGPGIDVKSTNGYVVAPGSEIDVGRRGGMSEKPRYRFEADVPIADAPEWLVQKLGEASLVARDPHAKREIPDAAPEVIERARDWIKAQPVGDEAFKTACGLLDLGLSESQALEVLAEHDGRPASVLAPKVSNAYTYSQNDPGTKAASAEDFPVLEAQQKRERPKRKLLRLDELSQHPPGPYLIKGLLQRRAHAVMYGSPGAGKTFVALDLAYHVASGLPWQGRRVHQGPVLYLAYEGIGGMAKRAAALAHQYEDAEVPLYVIGADYNLREKDGRQALAEDLAQLPDKPVLVVIDTLARAMKGGDENSAQDMGALNDAIGALIENTGAAVLLIHHSGKNKSSGARGSSALLGAIDTELEVDSHQVFSRKQRDIELADPHAFKLVPVVIGMDEDKDEVTSCIVEPAQYVPPTSLASLTENQRLGWDALCALAEDNAPVPADEWRKACEEFLPERSASARKAFCRLKTGLAKKGLIDETGDLVHRRMM